MKLSLCLTNYNRTELLAASFAQVLKDERIGEVVISDDCSSDSVWEWLVNKYKDEPKVRLHRNEVNLGMLVNKNEAISLAKYKWCILFDSDNVLTTEYLDALFTHFNENHYAWQDNMIYMPTGALPNFDYSKYAGSVVFKTNAKALMNEPMFVCALNTCNYVVNRDSYLKVFNYNAEMKATDTIWFNYNWLKNNGGFFFVPNMTYQHLVHDESGFMQDYRYNLQKGEEVKKMIMAL